MRNAAAGATQLTSKIAPLPIRPGAWCVVVVVDRYE